VRRLLVWLDLRVSLWTQTAAGPQRSDILGRRVKSVGNK
jgi:hypothetical protein